MKRIPVTPRSDYREKIEALGFDFHGDYWREEAYYRFTAEETACLRKQPMRRTVCIVRLLNSLLKITRNLWSVH